MFPLAFVAGSLQGHWWGFISQNYVVWPIFSLMNVFIALKGTQFLNFHAIVSCILRHVPHKHARRKSKLWRIWWNWYYYTPITCVKTIMKYFISVNILALWIMRYACSAVLIEDCFMRSFCWKTVELLLLFGRSRPNNTVISQMWQLPLHFQAAPNIFTII